MEKDEIIDLINKKSDFYDHKRCEALGEQEEIEKIKAIKSIDELCKYSSTEIFSFLKRCKCEDVESVNNIAILVDCYNKDTQARRDVIERRLNNIVTALQSYSYIDYSLAIDNFEAGLNELIRLKEIASEDERVTPFPPIEQMNSLFSNEDVDLVNRLKKWILLTNMEIFNRNIIKLGTNKVPMFDERADKIMMNLADALSDVPEQDMDKLDVEVGNSSLKEDEPIVDDEYIYDIQLDDDERAIVSSVKKFVNDSEAAIESLPITTKRTVTQFLSSVEDKFSGYSYEELNNMFNEWVRGLSEKYDRELLLKASIYDKLVGLLNDLDYKFSSVDEANEMKKLVLADISRLLNYYDALSVITDSEVKDPIEETNSNSNDNIKLVFLAPSYGSKSYFEDTIDKNDNWQSPNYKSMLMKIVDSLKSGHICNSPKSYGNFRLKTCGSDFGLFFRSFENNGITYVLVGSPTLIRDANSVTSDRFVIPNSVLDDITTRISHRDRSEEDRKLYEAIIEDSDAFYEYLKASTEKNTKGGGM